LLGNHSVLSETSLIGRGNENDFAQAVAQNPQNALLSRSIIIVAQDELIFIIPFLSPFPVCAS